MATLRVFRRGTLLVELDLRERRVDVGDRPGDAVRLDELGREGVGGSGGRFEEGARGWTFAARTGADPAPRPLGAGERIPLGDGAVELVHEAPGARLDVKALPRDTALELELQTLALSPGSAG